MIWRGVKGLDESGDSVQLDDYGGEEADGCSAIPWTHGVCGGDSAFFELLGEQISRGHTFGPQGFGDGPGFPFECDVPDDSQEVSSIDAVLESTCSLFAFEDRDALDHDVDGVSGGGGEQMALRVVELESIKGRFDERADNRVLAGSEGLAGLLLFPL